MQINETSIFLTIEAVIRLYKCVASSNSRVDFRHSRADKMLRFSAAPLSCVSRTATRSCSCQIVKAGNTPHGNTAVQ